MRCIAECSSAVPQGVATHLLILKDVPNVKFSALAETSDNGHVEHRPVTRGAQVGRSPPRKFFFPPEKNVLDIG